MKVSDIRAVIFDFDDTLLDNHPDGMLAGLHGLSRLEAAHTVGKRHGSTGLQTLNEQDAVDAIYQAKVHTLHGAVWQMLVMAGEVSDGDIDSDHPLLKEIVQLKDELHEEVLRTRGKPFPGAIAFVESLAGQGLKGKTAIASTAYRRDINLFLDMTGLRRFFPDKRVVSREQLAHPKPNPDAYNQAFGTLGLPEKARSSVVAFEDDPMGIMSAKAAGLYVYALTSRFDKKALAGLSVPPDRIADSYAEFSTLFGLPKR